MSVIIGGVVTPVAAQTPSGVVQQAPPPPRPLPPGPPPPPPSPLLAQQPSVVTVAAPATDDNKKLMLALVIVLPCGACLLCACVIVTYFLGRRDGRREVKTFDRIPEFAYPSTSPGTPAYLGPRGESLLVVASRPEEGGGATPQYGSLSGRAEARPPSRARDSPGASSGGPAASPGDVRPVVLEEGEEAPDAFPLGGQFSPLNRRAIPPPNAARGLGFGANPFNDSV